MVCCPAVHPCSCLVGSIHGSWLYGGHSSSLGGSALPHLLPPKAAAVNGNAHATWQANAYATHCSSNNGSNNRNRNSLISYKIIYFNLFGHLDILLLNASHVRMCIGAR